MNEVLQQNRAQSRRLVELGMTLTPHELQAVIHGEWTIAATFAHIAFWDRVALAVLERWAAGEPFRIDVPHWYDDVLNNSLLTELLALDPTVALRLAEAAVSALDSRLSGLTAEATTKLHDDASRAEIDANWLLHRYRHRTFHLDEIEAALRGRG